MFSVYWTKDGPDGHGGNLSKAIRTLLTFLLLYCGALPASADDLPSTTGTPIEFSVLTPGIEGPFRACTGIDLSMVGITGLTDIARTKALRKLVEEAGYDPSRQIADTIVVALRDAGRTGIHEPIPRRPPGRIQALSADDLPREPKGALLLDITINWIGLCSAVSFDAMRPAFSLTWRLISRDGKLVAPGRELQYVHQSERRKPKLTDPALHSNPKSRPAAPPPETETQKFCSFPSITAAQKDTAALWNCFDEAYLAAARKLVDQLPKEP